MSVEALVSSCLLGLTACYWAGVKFGTTVRILKNLGSHA